MKYQVGDCLLLHSGWVKVMKITEGFMTVKPISRVKKSFTTTKGEHVEFSTAQSYYISPNAEALLVKRHGETEWIDEQEQDQKKETASGYQPDPELDQLSLGI